MPAPSSLILCLALACVQKSPPDQDADLSEDSGGEASEAGDGGTGGAEEGGGTDGGGTDGGGTDGGGTDGGGTDGGGTDGGGTDGGGTDGGEDTAPPDPMDDPVTLLGGCEGGDLVGDATCIEARTFIMGCDLSTKESCSSDSSPRHEVTLTHAWYMGLTEVTQDQFLALTGDAPSYFADCGGDCPVEMVNWHMAAWYANLRSEAEGLTPFYECVARGEGLVCTSTADPYAAEGWRLPTEAEWEAAASCGEGTLYAGSNLVDEVAWYDGNAGAHSHAVASLAPNACGLYDLSGNVSEWVHDWYDPATYSAEESVDPVGADSGIMRILRGGSWYNLADSVQISLRGPYDPAHPNASSGFRLARTVPEGG